MTNERDNKAMIQFLEDALEFHWCRRVKTKKENKAPLGQFTTVRHCYEHGFLSGVEYARTPIKIDPKDESTWPPKNGQLLVWYKDRFIGKVEIFNKNASFEEFTHWMPIPKI